MQRESIDAFLQLHSYLVGNADPTKMTPQEATAAMIDVRHAYAHLDATEGISQPSAPTTNGPLHPNNAKRLTPLQHP